MTSETTYKRLTKTEPTEKRGWQAIVGTFANDPYYDEVMCLGQEWREAQRDPSPNDAALFSEASLAEDWNKPEEDEAWLHLQQAQ